MTIHHVPGKSNVVADALSHCPDLAAVIWLIESSFLTPIRKAQAAGSGDSCELLKKAESACEHGFLFCDGLLCQTNSENEISLVIPKDAGLQTDLLWQFLNDHYSGHLGVYHMGGALSKDSGRKNCMLMLNNTVNGAWLAMERRL